MQAMRIIINSATMNSSARRHLLGTPARDNLEYETFFEYEASTCIVNESAALLTSNLAFRIVDEESKRKRTFQKVLHDAFAKATRRRIRRKST